MATRQLASAGPADAALPDQANLIPVRPSRLAGGRIGRNVVLAILGSAFALPLIWLALASIDKDAGLGLKLPTLTADNYTYALQADRLRSLWMSAVVSTIATVVSTSAAILASYALSKRHIPFKAPAMLVTLFLTGVPVSILVIPVYEMFAALNWLSLVPTSIFLGVTSLPFQIWMIKNAYDDVPLELEEAARIERAGTLQTLWRVMIPLSLPGIAAAAIFGFINAWGNFIVPLVLLQLGTDQPAPIMIYSYMGLQGIRWGGIAAFSVVYSLPVIALFVLMSRLYKGVPILGGAVKG